ncbi:MAG: tRNA pseudouridine(55) synthase TruB [Cyanobacteria bacterium REEB67]|nr:tRNA pseudouridine(55) synthase TruB [Cyanobacteria bacterium REEB67]
MNPDSVNAAVKKNAALSGFLNVSKPAGMTSHDVVNRVRRITGIKQVGHAGTLDPMATGVMVVALGKACRLLRFLADDKSYRATITLGLITDTDDITGKVLHENEKAKTAPPEREAVAVALDQFCGAIEQIPPFYSAIHVDGKRLYELARSGQAPPEIKPRPVVIYKIELLSYEAPVVVIRVHCSKGTYIRSIARDLGQKLGLGGTLSGLVRETSGRFNIDKAAPLDEMLADPKAAMEKVVPVENALRLPLFEVDAENARRLGLGQKITADNLPEPAAKISEDQEEPPENFVLVSNATTNHPFCVGRVGEKEGQRYLAPEVVFADA